MATSTTTTGTTTTDSSQDDGTIMHVDSMTPLSSTLPSFVVYNKGLMEEERDEGISKSLLSLWELGNTSRLWMRRDDDDDDNFWSSPFYSTKRLQCGDKSSLFVNYHGVGTVQDDNVDDELVPPRIILRDDYEETRNHYSCDSPLHGHITDFGQALTYNTNVAIANAELMHRIVETIQMDYSYDCVEEEEEEEEVIEYDSEDDEDLSLLRYDFVRLDHFHQDRVQEEEPQDDVLITTTTLDHLLLEEEEEEEVGKTYDLEQEESYATQMFLDYERERHFIVAQIEPACNEMKYVVDSLDNDCDPEDDDDEDDDEYDDSIKNRWYAQISSNIHGIYYYQPSTGNISRSEPFSYMDTSQVRCFGHHYSSTREKDFVRDDKELQMYLDDITVDKEFVKLVSPMKQKTIIAKKWKHKENSRGKISLLLFMLSWLAAIILSHLFGWKTRTNLMSKHSVEAVETTKSWQSGLVHTLNECPLHEIESSCENVLL